MTPPSADRRQRRFREPVFPTPRPLFSLARNSRLETTRSISVAGAPLTRSERCARFSTKHPAPSNPAAAASTSKDAGISPAGPASESAAQSPQNPFQHTAVLEPRTAALVLSGSLGEQRSDLGIELVSMFHWR